LETRKAVFAKSFSSLSDVQINLWKKALTKEFVSSEESVEEDFGTTDNAGSSRHSVLAIKPLSWRARKVDRFFKRLDHKASKGKSKQSKQQMLPCIRGRCSSRTKSPHLFDDFFGFTAP